MKYNGNISRTTLLNTDGAILVEYLVSVAVMAVLLLAVGQSIRAYLQSSQTLDRVHKHTTVLRSMRGELLQKHKYPDQQFVQWEHRGDFKTVEDYDGKEFGPPYKSAGGDTFGQVSLEVEVDRTCRSGSGFTPCGDGKMRLITLNLTDHLIGHEEQASFLLRYFDHEVSK